MSHCDHLCVAIIGRSASYAGLGIGIEDEGLIENGLRDIVCRADELEQAPFGRDADVTKIFFVAKEAVFKAYYPAARVFLDFHDAAVVFDEHARSFRVKLIAPRKPALAGGYSFLGRLGEAEGHLVAVVTVAANADGAG
jgi:4'-phosphopantetheinyl transferase EntD